MAELLNFGVNFLLSNRVFNFEDAFFQIRNAAADNLNEYERNVALFLDHHPQVLWWYRNLVGRENFAIQGFRRQRIYPDFVVQEGEKTKPVARVLEQL